MPDITLGNGIQIRHVILDGEQQRKIKCPDCGIWGLIDDDQWHGRVSVNCPNCDYHETHDLASMYADGPREN